MRAITNYAPSLTSAAKICCKIPHKYTVLCTNYKLLYATRLAIGPTHLESCSVVYEEEAPGPIPGGDDERAGGRDDDLTVPTRRGEGGKTPGEAEAEARRYEEAWAASDHLTSIWC